MIRLRLLGKGRGRRKARREKHARGGDRTAWDEMGHDATRGEGRGERRSEGREARGKAKREESLQSAIKVSP